MRHHVHLMSTRLSQHQSRAFVLALMWILYMADVGGVSVCDDRDALGHSGAESGASDRKKKKKRPLAFVKI